ncbi:hypothetical protein GCM10027186_33760 [Micromonospora schwarzwaldensis]
MKCASETNAIRANAGMSSGCAYARSIASRARSIARFDSSTARLIAAQATRGLVNAFRAVPAPVRHAVGHAT